MLNNICHKFLCVVTLFCCCAFSWADTIVLKEGQSLTGNILAEKENQLIIDIGVTVVTIPKEKILEYQYEVSSRPTTSISTV